MSTRTKSHRLWRTVEKYVLNPQVRLGMRFAAVPSSLALLETKGRRTGLLRQTPVGNGLNGETFWLVSEHGTHSGYVHNLTANPRVRLKAEGQWRTGTAHLLPEDDAWVRRRRIDATNGRSGRIDGWFFRRSATTSMTIRIDLDPPAPTP